MGILLVTCLLLVVFRLGATELDDCKKVFLKGNYSECLRLAREGMAKSQWDDGWPLILARVQLTLGQYPEAEKTVSNALGRFDNSVPLRLLAIEVFNANGHTGRSRDLLVQLNEIVRTGVRSTRSAALLTSMGRAALLLKLDPKLVLENFFDAAKRFDANARDPYLASGELALDKGDFQLAAKTYAEGLKKFPDDPDIEFGLARAYASSDGPRMAGYLDKVLDYNTNYVPAILMYADHLIDAEAYGEADKMLARALQVNPWHPEAWAYRAIIAQLKNDAKAEAAAQSSACKFWPGNPQVEYLIGRKLSQKYRFTEGAAHQQKALQFDPDYLPAKIQLAQDFLRLGLEFDGWELVNDVHTADGYDVTAYNLSTLHETLGKFRTLTNQDFILRMTPSEADIYGDRVLALLQRAKDALSVKYGMKLDRPTTVEIFAEQKDFGVRTFGVAHNPGFLGVCFGHVITANSPAAQSGHPENWEGVLWHEFCHVITLGLTRNKMPRWLSEGISVYESRLENGSWDRGMNARYREMILDGELTKVGELSSAFMSPKTPMHMQFAYFESSLVVEYLVQKYGLEAVKQILVDLGTGVAINEALAKRTVALEKLEADFTEYATTQAKNLAPGLDWTRTKDSESDGPSAREKNPKVVHLGAIEGAKAAAHAHNPTNYWDLIDDAQTAMEARKWAEAKGPLEKVISLYSNAVSAYHLLAAVQRNLNQTNEEIQVLSKIARLEGDSTDTFLRLMQLGEETGDWKMVAENGERFIAVNPLVPEPYRRLARANEAGDQIELALRAWQRLLLLDPPDPAEVHYHLALLLKKQGEGLAAKRHVLQALEEAPRYRAAQKLLLEIEKKHPPEQRAEVPSLPVGK